MSSGKAVTERSVTRVLDIVVIAILLVTGVISVIHVYRRQSAGDDHRVAEIQVDGRVIHTIPLRDGGPDTLISLKLPRGEGFVHIEGGRIRVLAMPDSVCPLHICSRTGWIERPGQLIACVPNRLLIMIQCSGMPGGDNLDAVTH